MGALMMRAPAVRAVSSSGLAHVSRPSDGRVLRQVGRRPSLTVIGVLANRGVMAVRSLRHVADRFFSTRPRARRDVWRPRQRSRPSRVHVHAVRPDLLERARLHGLDDRTLGDELREAVRDLATRDARVVICTCSTIGGVSEQCASEAGVHVLRVDRPMAELAVRSASRIGVVATLESTLSPTRALLYDAALAAGSEVTLIDAFCSHAWARFEEGDMDGYQRAVARCVDDLDSNVQVAVLAQASMAGAAALVKSDCVVLTSPRSAVQAAFSLGAAADREVPKWGLPRRTS